MATNPNRFMAPSSSLLRDVLSCFVCAGARDRTLATAATQAPASSELSHCSAVVSCFVAQRPICQHLARALSFSGPFLHFSSGATEDFSLPWDGNFLAGEEAEGRGAGPPGLCLTLCPHSHQLPPIKVQT